MTGYLACDAIYVCEAFPIKLPFGAIPQVVRNFLILLPAKSAFSGWQGLVMPNPIFAVFTLSKVWQEFFLNFTQFGILIQQVTVLI